MLSTIFCLHAVPCYLDIYQFLNLPFKSISLIYTDIISTSTPVRLINNFLPLKQTDTCKSQFKYYRRINIDLFCTFSLTYCINMILESKKQNSMFKCKSNDGTRNLFFFEYLSVGYFAYDLLTILINTC